jgi:hypothetical protein
VSVSACAIVPAGIGTVVITGLTDASISWLWCRRLEGKSHPSLFLDDELARVVGTEAAVAVAYWWRVSANVVRAWRRFLDVTRTNNPRTLWPQRASARAGAEAVKWHESTQRRGTWRTG